MYALPTAPRPIGGVLDDAIRLYRASLNRCWLLAAVGAVASGALNAYQTLSMGTLQATSSAQSFTALAVRMRALEHTPGLTLSWIAMIVVWLVIRAAIVARQHAAATGREDSIGAALAFGVRRLPSTVITGIAWAILVFVGTLLLVIPGIWLWGMFQLWFVAVCVEELPPLKPLARSWQLVERNWWRATTVVTVALIIVVILSLAANVVAGLMVAVTNRNIGTFLFTSQLIAAAISVFTTPLMTVVMLSIYYDLKLRREGGDLAMRLSSLQPA